MKKGLGERIEDFAAAMMMVVDQLPTHSRGTHVGEQLFRASSRAGSFYNEAMGATTRKDRRHKFGEALKEQREARYWLALAVRSGWGVINGEELLDEASQLVAMLTAACKGLE